MMPTVPPINRFWSKVDKNAPNGCWQWTAAKDGVGYGIFWLNGAHASAHRFAYELGVGPIPEGLSLDHLCRNRACVNPAHLEPVTHRTNVLRGVNPAAINARKTHCIHGHEFTPENTYIRRTPRGLMRQCRSCRRAAQRK